MKNNFCEVDEAEIRQMPDEFQGFLLSRFSSKTGWVYVPEDTFREMIAIIAEAGKAATHSHRSPTE